MKSELERNYIVIGNKVYVGTWNGETNLQTVFDIYIL